MNRMRLTVLSAEATILETEIEYVNLPMEFGSLGVLPGHEQMLCKLASGILRLRCEEGHNAPAHLFRHRKRGKK